MIVIALWGCTSTEPDLVAMRGAMGHWEAGEAQLASDPAAARGHFSAARTERDDALLMAWEAEAAAASGDATGALQLLDEALGVQPKFAEARYRRAALRVAQGSFTDAAADLQRALTDGAIEPATVLDDPAFAAALGHEAFEFLPRSALVATLDEPLPSETYLGNDLVLRIALRGRVGPRLSVRGAVTGPLVLVAAVEERGLPDGPPAMLTVTWRVEGAGAIVVGPLTLGSADHTTELPRMTVTAAAPPDRPAVLTPPVSLRAPTELAADFSGAGAALIDGQLRVLAPPQHSVETATPLGPAARFEARDGGVQRWVVHVWSASEAGEVRVTGPDGTTAFVGVPARR